MYTYDKYALKITLPVTLAYFGRSATNESLEKIMQNGDICLTTISIIYIYVYIYIYIYICIYMFVENSVDQSSDSDV